MAGPVSVCSRRWCSIAFRPDFADEAARSKFNEEGTEAVTGSSPRRRRSRWSAGGLGRLVLAGPPLPGGGLAVVFLPTRLSGRPLVRVSLAIRRDRDALRTGRRADERL